MLSVTNVLGSAHGEGAPLFSVIRTGSMRSAGRIPVSMEQAVSEDWAQVPTVAADESAAQSQRPTAFQSSPGIIRLMNSSKSGTVNAVSP